MYDQRVRITSTTHEARGRYTAGHADLEREAPLSGFLSSLSGPSGAGKTGDSGYAVADVYRDLRQKVLAVDPSSLGLAPLFRKAHEVITQARLATEQCRAGAGVNGRDKDDSTPILFAAQHGFNEIVRGGEG